MQTARRPRSNYAEGYRLWLRYDPIEDEALRLAYETAARSILMPAGGATLEAARDELALGLEGLTGEAPGFDPPDGLQGASLVVGTPESCPLLSAEPLRSELRDLGGEGYLVARRELGGRSTTVIAADTDVGVLYGVFAFLRLARTGHRPEALERPSRPKVALRMLDHWDNLDGTVERGYAGFSIWDWHRLPDYLPRRYRDYARANASIGINAVALTNVNADALSLTAEYIEKAAALAGVLRPYGIRVFLSARFSAPIDLGAVEVSDPLDPRVAAWWAAKADEIYRSIPDFGGFVVKANSEGQPGPQDYGRSHADGANMLAAALAPRGGTLIWRAFVYAAVPGTDRARQAYEEFAPLDGKFLPNVFVQVKNGPIDFMPREPFHPLFGAMPRTPLALEFQITQEYLGQASHLVYLGPLFSEVLNSDTFCAGPGSTVARIVDGSLDGHAVSCIAAVANIGASLDWCGNHFAQSNWYAFGRLAWDHGLDPRAIAEEWARLTFTSDAEALEKIVSMMMLSREAVVDYMTPLGLMHIMGEGHHYGPAPWFAEARPDWTSVYFHRADELGIGFERGSAGSDAVSQYFPPFRDEAADPRACPESLLLYFHHVPWDRAMRSGRTLWDELCLAYQRGVDEVRAMGETWKELEPFVDPDRHAELGQLLALQSREAVWWKDACLAYFATFSKRPIPAGVEPPARDLEYYRGLKPRYAPGHGRIKS